MFKRVFFQSMNSKNTIFGSYSLRDQRHVTESACGPAHSLQENPRPGGRVSVPELPRVPGGVLHARERERSLLPRLCSCRGARCAELSQARGRRRAQSFPGARGALRRRVPLEPASHRVLQVARGLQSGAQRTVTKFMAPLDACAPR